MNTLLEESTPLSIHGKTSGIFRNGEPCFIISMDMHAFSIPVKELGQRDYKMKHLGLTLGYIAFSSTTQLNMFLSWQFSSRQSFNYKAIPYFLWMPHQINVTGIEHVSNIFVF